MEVTSLPQITILATGGTIAGSSPSPADSAYASATLHVDELIASVPSLGELAQVEGEQVAQVGSQDVGPKHWLDLAHRARICLAREGNAGVVVTHGTDTYILNPGDSVYWDSNEPHRLRALGTQVAHGIAVLYPRN